MLAAVAASVLAFAASLAGAGPADTELRIRVWPEGRGEGAARAWTLSCAPVRGTLPRRASACRQLATTRRPFDPIRTDMQCTQIYGGPAEALVTGTHRGAKVWALFSRTDGCQIARWRNVAFLTPGFGGGRS